MKLSEWKLKISTMNEGVLARLNGMADSAAARFASLQDKINKGGQAFRDAANEVPFLGKAIDLLTNPITLITAGVIALGAALYKASDYAEHFQEGMAKINATAQLAPPKLDELRNTLIDMGKNTSADLSTIPDAFEKIISQVGEVDTSLSIMKTALAGAQAGFTDVDTVAGALAQTLSIVGKENTTASEVMDTLFAAKRVGAGEFKDFATYMPTLIAAGKNLGITFKDTAGLFAYMTGKGQNAADSAVLIQNAFTALGKSEVQKGFEGAGVKLFDKTGTMRDINAIMTDLKARMSGLSDQAKSNLLESMGLRDVQAKNAFSILTSDVGKLNEALNATRNAVGETNNALEYTKNPATENAIMMNKFKAIFLEIGYAIMPYVQAAFTAIGNAVLGIIQYFRDLYNSGGLFHDLVNMIGLAFWAIWEVVGFIADIIRWIYDHSLKLVFDALGWIYEKVKGIVQWFRDLYDKSTLVRGVVDGIRWAFEKISDVLSWLYNHTIKPIVDAVKWIYDSIAGLFDSGDKTLNVTVGKTVMQHVERDPNKMAPWQEKFRKSPTGQSQDKLKKGLSEINDGGRSTRNVYVNITKLVESLNINTTNLKEGAAEIEKKVEEFLLRSVHGGEIALTNQ